MDKVGDEELFKLLMITNPEMIKRLRLSDEQVVLFNVVGQLVEASTPAVAEELMITIQSASNRLAQLYRKGYVDRRIRRQESGGFQFLYFTKVKGLDSD